MTGRALAGGEWLYHVVPDSVVSWNDEVGRLVVGVQYFGGAHPGGRFPRGDGGLSCDRASAWQGSACLVRWSHAKEASRICGAPRASLKELRHESATGIVTVCHVQHVPKPGNDAHCEIWMVREGELASIGLDAEAPPRTPDLPKHAKGSIRQQIRELLTVGCRVYEPDGSGERYGCHHCPSHEV